MVDLFVCPESRRPLARMGDAYVTEDGSHRYPVVEGIPVLVRNPEGHLESIRRLTTSRRGGWFTEEQLDRYERGPYRHHLARRRRVVETAVRRFVREAGGEGKGDLPLRVLDLGCGDGGSSRWLAEALPRHAKLLLTDYNIERLIRAREVLGSREASTFFLSDIVECPLADESCDLVFSNHVIEHVPDDERVFEAARRTLRPGGAFLLGCPNEGVFWWMLAYALSPRSIRHSDHIHFYNSDVLVEMGRRAGLLHQRTEVLGYGVPHWGWDERLRQYKRIDDLFHWVGSRLVKNQGSSLYLTFAKAR